MRIIGGSARGRPLKTPIGQDIRPTSDKVRLAMFNALFSRGGVVGAHVLDAFCGTGALGCEALSHGADHALFCDLSKTSLALAKDNVRTLGFADRADFQITDASRMGERPAQCAPRDLVFLDPPYRKGLIAPTLTALIAGHWLAEDALIVIETETNAPSLPTDCGTIVFDKTYGETQVVFLRASAVPLL